MYGLTLVSFTLTPPCATQATLSWISIISPYTPYGPTLGLTFVLLVGAITAIWQDVKRHKEDSLMNSSVAHVMQEMVRPHMGSAHNACLW